MSILRQAGERFRDVICEKVVGLEDLRLDSSRSENETQDLYAKRLEQIQFRDMYTKALERGVINLNSSDDIKVMIHAMKKKVKSAKEKSVIISAVRQIGVFAHHPKIFSQETATTLLFREIKYAFLPKRTVIFNQGDIGDTYYMIIKGEVYCLVPTAKNEIKPIDDKKKKKKAVGLLPSNSSTNNSHEHNGSNLIKVENNPSKLLDCTDEVFLEREYPQFKSVKVFKNWEGFGDIALITQQYRTATMLCKEDTHLICLTKSGFDKIIGEISRQQKITQVKFLKQFPFFSAIPKYKLMSILMDIEILQCAKNKVLYKEGDPIENVYMILEGEVEISKKHSVDRQEADVVKQFEKTELINNNQLNTSIVYKQQAINTRHIGLTIIGPNSYCGIDDLFNHKTIRETTAQCLTNGVIYSLNKDKFLDSLRVNKQFDRDNTACIEKDILMSSRAKEIAYYIDKLTNKFIQTYDPAEMEEKLKEQLNHKEKPRRILTNPRDIIKERIYLGKEILAERAIKLAKLHASQEEKKRMKSQEMQEQFSGLENEQQLENTDNNQEEFKKSSGNESFNRKPAVSSKDNSAFGSQNAFSRKESTPLQGAAYKSTSTKRIISNRNIGLESENQSNPYSNRSNGSFVVENCEVNNQSNSRASQEPSMVESKFAAPTYKSTPGITSTSALNTQGNYSQPDMSLNDQIQEEYGGQQRIQLQTTHKSQKNIQEPVDSSYLISDFSRSSSSFQKSRQSNSFVLKKQFLKISSQSPQKNQQFQYSLKQKQISQDQYITNGVSTDGDFLNVNKNEQQDKSNVSENLQNRCLRLLSQEAMETRVDSCELNNFERISRDYPHLKTNSVLKQFLATHVDSNKQKELSKSNGTQSFMRQFNGAVKVQLDYINSSKEDKMQNDLQRKKIVSFNNNSNFFKVQNQGNKSNVSICENTKTLKIPYCLKETRIRIGSANQDITQTAYDKEDQNNKDKSFENVPQNKNNYYSNINPISDDRKILSQQKIQNQSFNESSYLVSKQNYFITAEKQQNTSKQLIKTINVFPSQIEQQMKQQDNLQNESQQVGIIISQNQASKTSSGFRKRNPFKSPLTVFEDLFQKRLSSNNNNSYALRSSCVQQSPNNRSGRIIHQNLSLNEQFHRLNSSSSIVSFGRKTRQASPSPSAIEGSYPNTKRNNNSLLLDFSLENSPKQPNKEMYQDIDKHASLADQVLEDGQNDDLQQSQQNGSFFISTIKLLGQKNLKSPQRKSKNDDENNRSTPSPVLCAKSRSYYYLPAKSNLNIQHRQKGLLRNSLQKDKQLNK